MTRRWLLVTTVTLVAAMAVSSFLLLRHPLGDQKTSTNPVVVTPTSSISSSSLCPSNDPTLRQSLNGDVTGCFRVPALDGSSLVVALQTYLFGRATPSPTTTTASSRSAGTITLSVRPTTVVTPGERVRVSGTYAGALATRKNDYATLCWDGCLTGLDEQGVPIYWSSPTRFSATLVVPDAPWLTSRGASVSVHPLTSGRYVIGIQCLTPTSGCALAPAESSTSIRLRAPTPTTCVSGESCASLQLSSSAATPGSIVTVSGWAPLQSLIGQPFGFNLSVAPAARGARYPNLSFSQTLKGGGFTVALAPQILHVKPSPTWASLGHVGYLAATWSGPSVVTPDPSTNRIGWCVASGLRITGTAAPVVVPSSTVAAALRGSALTMLGTATPTPPCATVQLDPRYPHTLYAGFDAEVGGSAPPVYLVGLYTSNGGATWRMVPTPAHTTPQDFAGYATDARGVVALFDDSTNYGTSSSPPGTVHGVVSTEVTSNGGASWTHSTLSCPGRGPCVTFGPYLIGNCAMNATAQPVLIGPAGANLRSPVTWTSSPSAPSVNNCFSQQLVATSGRDLLLLDPGSQYPMLRSTDSGRSWSDVSLPRIPGTTFGYNTSPGSDSLVFAPDGSLFAAVAAPGTPRQELFRLTPGARSWCQVPGAFASVHTSTTVGPLRVTATSLLWSETVYPNDAPATSSLHVVPLSTLRC